MIELDNNGCLSCAMRGRPNQDGETSQKLETNQNDYANALTSVQKDSMVLEKEQVRYRIRKLTPKECWRLMGFPDEAFEKAKAAKISDSQLYKQAGNSIVVDVLYYIFKELYESMPYLFDDLKVGSYFSGIGAFEYALDRLFSDIGRVHSGAQVEQSGGRDIIVYDDYNHRVRKEQDTIGTLTTNIGASSLRAAYKLIERGCTDE